MALQRQDPEQGEPSVLKLMEAVDTYMCRCRTREVDKPFLMPIEDVFSISGRGTVVTGRVERGKIVKVGEEVEILWALKATTKTVVTGRRDVPQAAGRGRRAGDNVGVAAAGRGPRGRSSADR